MWEIIAAVVAIVGLLSLVGFIAKPVELEKGYYRERWKQVVAYAQNETTWLQAIVAGDRLLDNALKARKYAGETMGERLIAAKDKLTRRQLVWEAHKLRNRLVHEDNVRLTRAQVHDALKGFEAGLKDLGAL